MGKDVVQPPSKFGNRLLRKPPKGTRNSKIDVGAVGSIKHKFESEIGENEKAVLKGELYDPIGYDSMCKVLDGEYREPDGSPIVRIAKQLGGAGEVITRELEVWARNPEVVWDWLGRQRRDLKTTGSLLASRETYIYFKDCSIVKSHKLSGVIERHCISLDFAGDLEESDGEAPQEKFANYLRTIGEHLDYGSIEKQFGQSDVYDGTQVILNNYRTPGSRAKGKDNDREGKGARRKGQQRDANLANGGDQSGKGDNYQLREEFGSAWGNNYRDIWGDQTTDVRYTGGKC